MASILSASSTYIEEGLASNIPHSVSNWIIKKIVEAYLRQYIKWHGIRRVPTHLCTLDASRIVGLNKPVLKQFTFELKDLL